MPITKCTYSANTTLERLQIESAKLARRSSPDVASCQGAMTVRFDGATLVAEAANGELVAIKCGFSMAEGWQVYFELFRVFLPKPKYAVSGPGGVEASFDGRAASPESGASDFRDFRGHETEV